MGTVLALLSGSPGVTLFDGVTIEVVEAKMLPKLFLLEFEADEVFTEDAVTVVLVAAAGLDAEVVAVAAVEVAGVGPEVVVLNPRLASARLKDSRLKLKRPLKLFGNGGSPSMSSVEVEDGG